MLLSLILEQRYIKFNFFIVMDTIIVLFVFYSSCPYKDNGPSKGWGLDDFKRYHGDVWDRKQNKYLWSEELMEGLQRAYR
jgi:hypothetical protein